MRQFFRDLGLALFCILIVGGLWGFAFCGVGGTALFSRAAVGNPGMKIFIVASHATIAGMLPWAMMGGVQHVDGDEVWPRRLAGISSIIGYLAGVVTAGLLGFGYW